MNPLIDRDQHKLYSSVSIFFLCGSPHTWQILHGRKEEKVECSSVVKQATLLYQLGHRVRLRGIES
jgi:hypothetical protein